MGLSVLSLQVFIFFGTLYFASLSCIGNASKHSFLQRRQPSLSFSEGDAAVVSSKLRGEAQEEAKDMLEVLHELEREVKEPPSLEMENLEGPLDKVEAIEEEIEERHPAEDLLQRLQADATISYILGGY